MGESLAAVEAELAECELQLCRARSKIYARVSHYSDLFEGENYDVDLTTAHFSGLQDGEVVSEGDLQILGTWHDGTFLWSWQNEALPPLSYKKVKDFCDAYAPLASILSQRKFVCEMDFAEKLAQYVALKMGYVGAFEAPNQKAVAYLLLNIAPAPVSVDIAPDYLWCAFCGRTRSQVRQFFAASETCAVCDVCVRMYREIAASESTISNDFNLKLPPCLLCGDKTRRIYTEYGAVCHDCINWSGFDAALES